jgi:MFS family permease
MGAMDAAEPTDPFGQPAESSAEPANGRGSRSGRSLGAVNRTMGTAGRAVARGGRLAVRQAHHFTHADGAGESGLARVLEMHAFNAAGDAALAISLAGTLFFTVPTDEAAGQVAIFLILTMVPFAIVAPLIGPFLDRFRRGRRWAIGATFAVRAFSAWVLAGAVADASAAFYASALTCLVASKAYGVTRAAAVPRVLPADFSLVKANSRTSLTGTTAAALSAPIAVGAATIGADWSLRYAFVLYVGGTVLAILLPARVDSSAGEQPADLTGPGRHAIGREVVDALRSNAGLRLLSGFLTIFMAFVLRTPPAALNWGGNATVLMALVIGGAGAGNTLGIVVGSWVRRWNPHRVVLAVLAADAVVLAGTAMVMSWWTMVVLGLSAGLCQSLGKLSLDALIQRDVAEEVRTSIFARSETLLQLSWVFGGLAGIGMFVIEASVNRSLLVVALAVLAWAAFVVTRAAGARRVPSNRPGPDFS